MFTAVAHDLLAAVLRPPRAVNQLLREVQRVLLQEAVDPNAARHGLLAAVEQRTHRHHLMATVA